YFPGQFAFS
nr:Chain L, Retinoic acid receptor responder protein 2 [Homo sapiens]8SG1_L Chain L, Chemerin 9 [Homo sapiens]